MSNTGFSRLDLNDAAESLLTPDSDATPEAEEVTAEENSEVSTEEAVVTEKQSDSKNLETGLDEEGEVEESEDEPEEESEDEPEENEDDSDVATEEDPDEDEDEPLTDETVLFTDPDGNEVTVDEAKKGYLRQSDYTKKTQALAQERETLQQEAQGLGAERTTLAENLNLALNVVEPQLAELARTDWDTLASSDAYEYAEKRALFDQAQARYAQLTNAAQQLVQQQNQQREMMRAQRLQQEQKALHMALPDMADPTKAKALRTSLREYALSAGLSEQEAGNITDHRMVVMMDKARRYDELQGSTLSAAKKKVSKTPRKVITKGKTPTKAERQNQKTKETRSRLKQTGTVDSAVDLLLS